MMNASYTAREPVEGCANQPPEQASLMAEIEPSLITRKGWLYLLCLPETDGDVLRRAYMRYYSSPCFDILPCLASALAEAQATSETRPAILAGVVLQGLKAYAVGNAEAIIWLVRAHTIKPLLVARQEHAITPPAGPIPLYTGQSRLYTDDTLVLTTQQAAARLASKAIHRNLQGGREPTAAARALARTASRGRARQPVTVIHLPGFSPVPDVGPAQRWQPPRPPKAQLRPPPKSSPIWTAALIALIAIAVSLWITKPSLSPDDLSHLLVWMLTPIPTATASPTAPTQTSAPEVAIATPEPTEASPADDYAAPELLSPRRAERVQTNALTLRWAWAGELGEDEYFDVRLWRTGSSKRSIGWTREMHYTVHDAEEGWHNWTVVVVRGQNGIIERELSDEPPPSSFHWSGED